MLIYVYLIFIPDLSQPSQTIIICNFCVCHYDDILLAVLGKMTVLGKLRIQYNEIRTVVTVNYPK